MGGGGHLDINLDGRTLARGQFSPSPRPSHRKDASGENFAQQRGKSCLTLEIVLVEPLQRLVEIMSGDWFVCAIMCASA